MPIIRKAVSELSPEEWEQKRRAMLSPGLFYWIVLFIALLGGTVRVMLTLTGPAEAIDWQPWAQLGLLVILWALFVRALWVRRRAALAIPPKK